ncbi:hypothetical protein D3C84_725110 [compost metagenome]
MADQAWIDVDTGLTQGILVAGHAVQGQGAAAWPLDDADAAVAEADQVLGHGLGGGAVVETDGRVGGVLDHFAGVDQR